MASSLAAGFSLVALDGAFFAGFCGVVHARVRGVAQWSECSEVLPGAGLVLCNVYWLASSAAA